MKQPLIYLEGTPFGGNMARVFRFLVLVNWQPSACGIPPTPINAPRSQDQQQATMGLKEAVKMCEKMREMRNRINRWTEGRKIPIH